MVPVLIGVLVDPAVPGVYSLLFCVRAVGVRYLASTDEIASVSWNHDGAVDWATNFELRD